MPKKYTSFSKLAMIGELFLRGHYTSPQQAQEAYKLPKKELIKVLQETEALRSKG